MTRAEAATLSKGQKVTYAPDYGEPERGKVKSFSEDPNFVFVVYNCGGNWDNYENYTAARTNIKDLKLGWGASYEKAK